MKAFSFMLRVLVVVAVCALAWSPVEVQAAACKIKVTPLAFGVYDVFSPLPRDATAQLTVSCNHKSTDPAQVTVALSAGGAGSFAPRAMRGSVGSLYYNLYTTPAMSNVFGDGTGGSLTLANQVDKRADWIIPVYGRIPPLQNVPVGTYSDAVVATILW